MCIIRESGLDCHSHLQHDTYSYLRWPRATLLIGKPDSFWLTEPERSRRNYMFLGNPRDNAYEDHPPLSFQSSDFFLLRVHLPLLFFCLTGAPDSLIAVSRRTA